ncbi:MAG: serine/threonine-protein kinase, partial [Pseudomonadota bacterium]
MKKISTNRDDILIGIAVSAIFIFLSFSAFSIFESLERVIYGIEMRLDLPQSQGHSKIAIVNIDEKSLQQLGRWPWPRHLIAEMITILKNNGAKLIGLDLLFSEREQNQGLLAVKALHNAVLDRGGNLSKDTWLLESLNEIERRLDNDSTLARKIMESGNVILPVLGEYGKYETELVLTPGSFLEKNTLNSIALKNVIEEFFPVNRLTTPFKELSENSHGLGHINLTPDKDKKGRVHLLFVDYRGHMIPSMPFRLAIDYLDKTPKEVEIKENQVLLGGLPINAVNGEMFIKYKGGRRSFPYYSFVDILNVKKVPAVFDNKIVLIGYTADGRPVVDTPVDPEMPRVELTANVIEDLINSDCLRRPNSIMYIESFLLLVLVLAGSLIMPRLEMVNRAGMAFLMIFLVFLVGLVFFIFLNIWLKTVYLSLSLFILFLAFSVKDFIIREKTLELSSKESIETNRMLGLSLQSQGLLDLAFEKFRKCPLDDALKDVVYNLGLDYERKRMTNKAIVVYEYITETDKSFRDLNSRIPKLKKLINPFASGAIAKKKEGKILLADDMEVKPTVGRYEILGELGQGAMGIVYRAKDPKINRMLAIKTIRFSDEFEEAKLREVKERFLKEAEIAGKLSHPSIVAIYDVGEDYDLTYLAMEFLDGEDLHKFCTKGSLLPLRRVLYIVGETATALEHAHSQEVIHRDIKPANIMLLKNGQVKVTDFGIAKAVSSSQTKSGVVLGTPNYMSPEQINGQELDGRSDIFSLGVVFYELLTGKLPFHGKNLTNLFYQITQAKHPSPREINPKVPKPCEQIIDKALA